MQVGPPGTPVCGGPKLHTEHCSSVCPLPQSCREWLWWKGHWEWWATGHHFFCPTPQRPASTLVLWVAWVGDRGRAHSHPCSGVSSLSQGHGARSPFFPVHSSRSSTRQPRSRNAALATSSQSGWAARACKMSSSAPKSRMGLEKTWLRDTRFRISMQACFWKTERM